MAKGTNREFTFDEEESFDSNMEFLFSKLEDIDSDMVQILKKNFDSLKENFNQGQRNHDARRHFNESVKRDLDALFESRYSDNVSK